PDLDDRPGQNRIIVIHRLEKIALIIAATSSTIPTRQSLISIRTNSKILVISRNFLQIINTLQSITYSREKSTIFIEDLTIVVETASSTTKKKFGHVLSLRYCYIRVSLLRDPQGRPYRILIEFKFEYIKGFLSVKDKNTYILPEIIFDLLLVLSPYIFLLGLLFADYTFKRVKGEEVLISAEQLPRLYIRDSYNELLLLLDPALDDIPVKNISTITSFRQVARPYSLRYGARKALDNSRAVSDLLRNLIIYYANTCTFLKYYLDRRINKNLPAIIRGLNLDNDIIYIAYRISRIINPNRP
ncbi:uncharacterized protein N7458_006108, partial [Penicillium daleae]